MSALPKQSLIGAAYQSYLSAGFALVPVNGKSPTSFGWNESGNAWSSIEQIDDTVGVGLAHAWSGTCAVDIDALPIFAELLSERGVNLQELMGADDAVMIDSGNPGHAKLIYKLPFTLPTKVIKRGRNIMVAELRCATNDGKTTQDVLPSLAVHPKTNQHYRWAGKGHYSKLPMLPTVIMELWQELLEEVQVTRDSGEIVFEEAELLKALHCIDPDCDRKTWIEVGMGLKDAGRNTDKYFDAWNDWSAKGTKYPGEHDLRVQWKSFTGDRADRITANTVFHHGTLYGWIRPTPNVDQLFSAIPVTKTDVNALVDHLDAVVPPPEVDLSLWPSVIVNRSVEIGNEVGCDPVVPLLAGLAAVSAAVDKRTTLNINPTWSVPPNIWLMTIGEPSDKKTPGSKPMFDPLKQLEIEDLPRYEVEMLLWQGKEARYAAEMQAYRDWEQSAEATFPGAVPPPVTSLPPKPEKLRLTVMDATTQKIVGMASGRPRGFLLYLDEMNRWLSKLSDSRSTDDRGCWVRGYETGSYTMDRVSSGTIDVENLALSVYGNCQPQVFLDNLPMASQDGIMQRFLPVSLDPRKNRVWQKAIPAFMSSAPDYEQLIRRTYSLPVMSYELSEAAFELFRGFSEWVIRVQKAEKVLSESIPYQTALGKLDGQCARLIQLFHIILDPYSTVVSLATAHQAITVVKEFFYPALRHTFIEIGQQRDPLAKAIMGVVMQWAGERETVTVGDLRRARGKDAMEKGKDAWKVDQAIRVIMDDLASLGYVYMTHDHPRYPTWAINPAVAEMFKEEREKIIDAKLIRQAMKKKNLEEYTGREMYMAPVIGQRKRVSI